MLLCAAPPRPGARGSARVARVRSARDMARVGVCRARGARDAPRRGFRCVEYASRMRILILLSVYKFFRGVAVDAASTRARADGDFE